MITVNHSISTWRSLSAWLHKAKGKRISNYEVKEVEELEPIRFPEPETQETMKVEIEDENGDTPISDSDLRDEITGQMKLFD